LGHFGPLLKFSGIQPDSGFNLSLAELVVAGAQTDEVKAE